MSVTVSTCAQICNSPLNKSHSKQLFSFPKSSRFSHLQKSNCELAFYDLPSVQMKRTAGFGYGHKYDFTKDFVQRAPAPNAYSLKSEFSGSAEAKARGISFGLGREALKTGGILDNKQKTAPGPGAYDLRSSLSNIAFTLRPKTVNSEAYSTALKSPGPGTYPNIPSINDKGKYFNSKFKSSGASLFNPRTSDRFGPNFSKARQVPGPGHYQPKTDITPDGNYFVSNFKSSNCRSFSHSIRKAETAGQTSHITPGPGTYRLPSEFGYYEAARKGGADPLESSGQMKGSVQNENTKSQGSLHNTSTQQASTQEKPKAQQQSSPAKNTSNQPRENHHKADAHQENNEDDGDV